VEEGVASDEVGVVHERVAALRERDLQLLQVLEYAIGLQLPRMATCTCSMSGRRARVLADDSSILGVSASSSHWDEMVRIVAPDSQLNPAMVDPLSTGHDTVFRSERQGVDEGSRRWGRRRERNNLIDETWKM
jgi:hypothetical protein